MAYHYDYIMRQIEIISSTLAYMLFGKKLQVEQVDPRQNADNDLYLLLSGLVRQGMICEAENLLYEALEDPNPAVLQAAWCFYSDLNEFSDAYLESVHFSRQEILEGLQNISEICGINL
jgi:hypothetical protein